ncbi:MAG: MFS transporter [Rubrobacteraceae bacterium]
MPGFLTGGLAVQMRQELGFGNVALGLAITLFFAFTSIFSVLSGWLVERFGSHRSMRLAAVGSAASMLGVAVFARSWTLLVVCLVVGGFANALAQPATHLSLAREIPSTRQGLSFGIKQAAIPTATLLAGLAVPTVALTVGWRWAFVGGALLAGAIAFLVPAGTEERATSVEESRSGDVRTGPLVLLAVGVGLGATAATPLGAFIVESAVATGIEVGRAGLLLALGSAVGITIRVGLGYLADFMPGGRLKLAAGMLGAGAIGFVLLATRLDYLFVVGTVVAFGAGWGWPGIFNFAVVKTNPGAPAAATGITQTGASGGAALGPLIFGFVLQATGYTTAWLVCGSFALLSAVVMLIGRYLILGGRARTTEKG